MARSHICPKCRALLPDRVKTCPYCETDQRYVTAPSVTKDVVATHRFGLWLIALNVVIFLAMNGLDPYAAEGGFFDTSGQALVAFGITDPLLVEHGGQYWRLATAVFLHLGLLHLVMNCYAIYILTPLAAVTFGAHRTIAIYLLTGIAAAYVSTVLGGRSGAGASGALCGLIGAAAAFGLRRKSPEGRMLARQMGLWAGIVLLYGLMPRIDNLAHATGLVAGAALGWIGGELRVRGGAADRFWRRLAWFCAAAFAGVGLFWFLPSAVGLLERRDVELYRSQAVREIVLLEEVRDGVRPAARLDRAFADAPRGADAVREALERARAAVRAGGAEAAAAIEDARTALGDWSVTVMQEHAIGLYREEP